MVKAALTCLLLAGPALAAPAYQVDKQELALGEALTLTLDARPGLLDGVDLTPLAQDFAIQEQTLNRSGQRESLALTLYPLRVGKIALPALGLPGRPPTVRISEQSERVPKVRFRVEIEPAVLHARQPGRLTVEACDDGSLDWARPQPPTREALVIRPLGEQQMDQERDGERCTAHRWHWAITPAAAGPLSVPLPLLEAGKFGQRLRFPAPEIHLDIQTVPSWLPMEAAVGPIDIHAEPLPATWPMQRPLAWRMEISGGYSPASLKAILAPQLAAAPGFAAYPPTVEVLPLETPSPRPRLALTLYAVAETTGPLTVPPLVLPWLDPVSGELGRQTLPGATVEIFNPMHAIWVNAGLGLVGAALTIAAFWHLRRSLQWRQSRRRGLARIAAAGNISELTRAVRAFSLKDTAQPAPTLDLWLARMARETTAVNLASPVAALNQASFATATAESADTGQFKRQVLNSLQRARPVPEIRN